MTESFFESNPLVAALLLPKTSVLRDVFKDISIGDRWCLYNACLPEYLCKSFGDACFYCFKYTACNSLRIVKEKRMDRIKFIGAFCDNNLFTECLQVCDDCYKKIKTKKIMLRPVHYNKKYKAEE